MPTKSKAAKVTMRTCITISKERQKAESRRQKLWFRLRRCHIMAREDAFTLIEILVTVLVVALLAGATVGSYLGTYKRLLVEKAANDVYLAAKYARIAAIEKRQSCVLSLNEEDSGFALMFPQVGAEDSDESGTLIANQYSRPGTFADGVKYEKIVISPSVEPDEEDLDKNIVTFRADGTADSAVIQIGDDKNMYTVYIQAATGKAKMKRGLPEEVAAGVIDLDAVLQE